jgi:hypothetical protein
MKAATVLVREKRFDAEALRIQATCLVCRSHIGDQIERGFLPFGPATEEHHRALGLFGHADIPSLDEGPRLDTGADGLASEALAVPHDGAVTPRPDHGGPAIRLYGVLEPRPIKCAIAKQDDPGALGDKVLDLLNQCDMESLRKMALLALTHQPRHRQGSTFVDHMEHQGDTPTPHDAPIHHEDERLPRQMRQEDLGERDTRPFLCDLVVPEPPRTACDPASRVGD